MTKPRALAAASLAVIVIGCTGIAVDPVGRACSDDQPCGPGTHCDPATQTCVKGPATPDASLDTAAPDKAIPDTGPPDSFKVPDGSCPSGYTVCGSLCIDTPSDIDHCGGCDKACDKDVADRCVNNQCVCGSAATASCSGGLNCTGGACACVAGGRCDGCCDGGACLPVGASQSVNKCGNLGETCKGCADTNECTADACSSAGTCENIKLDKTSCDDGKDCTHTDTCSAGVCTGMGYTCDDSLTCTTDACTGSAPPTGCTFTLKASSCLIGGKCYADKDSDPSDSCNRCLAAVSVASWSPAKGCVTTLAGNGIEQFKAGAALEASFNDPTDVAVGGSRVFVLDRDNFMVRVIEAGQVKVLAGSGIKGFKDGPAQQAQFDDARCLAVAPGGKVYVADKDNHRIRLISGGQVTTIAGTGGESFADGPALSAKFDDPVGVAVDGSGKLYIGDRDNYRIRVIASGVVTTLAGTGTAGLTDGPVAQAQFYDPYNVTVDGAGAVYVADYTAHRIRRIAGGVVSTIAGSGSVTTPGFQDGPAGSSRLSFPRGLVVDSSGTVYFADEGNHRIRKISGGIVSTVAGTGVSGFLDGPVASTKFNNPRGLDIDKNGILYVADSDSSRIRLILP